MKKYQHVLVAIELDPDIDQLLVSKAKSIAETFDSTLTLIHAVEHLSNYGAAYGITVGFDVEEELVGEAKAVMKKLGEQLQVPEKRQVVGLGPARQLILEEAKERESDLIIVGSHGKHGVRLLLGSTANAVLHGANCDVLAIRVQD